MTSFKKRVVLPFLNCSVGENFLLLEKFEWSVYSMCVTAVFKHLLDCEML